MKEGNGQLINKEGQVVYSGEFRNDLPHGKGIARDDDGRMKERNWVEGIDKTFLME